MKGTIIRYVDVFSARLPQIFSFLSSITNINIRPLFPDYLFVSHDQDARNLDEYCHFYRIDGQKFKMKKIFVKI